MIGSMPEIEVLGDSIRCPGLFSARLSGARGTGATKGGKIGDSFLVNLRRRLFAVGDAPDWNANASQMFLESLNREVDCVFRSSRGGGSVHEGERLGTDIVRKVNGLVERTDRSSSTAFTCAILMDGSSGAKAMMLHCGDTVLFQADVSQRWIRQVSWTNMGFAGRAGRLSQVETIDIHDGTRLFLCSDGIHAVIRNGKFSDTKSIVLDALCRFDIGQVSDAILDSYAGSIELPDDVVVVALDPGRLLASAVGRDAGGEPGRLGDSAWCYDAEKYGTVALTAT